MLKATSQWDRSLIEGSIYLPASQDASDWCRPLTASNFACLDHALPRAYLTAEDLGRGPVGSKGEVICPH